MHNVYKILFLVVVAVSAKTNTSAQVVTDTSGVLANSSDSLLIPDTTSLLQKSVSNLKDTVPVSSVNVELENIFNAKAPTEYIISDIKVTGTKSFDPNLIISISGLAVGDKVMIPGGDNFSKAINNLWKQGLIADAEVYFTNLSGKNLSIELNITDRPTLASFKFKGVSKSESDDLSTKLGLSKGRQTRVTENLKISSSQALIAYSGEKTGRSAYQAGHGAAERCAKQEIYRRRFGVHQ